MNPVIDRALPLWAGPVPTDDDLAVAAFAEVYANPVMVNGEPTSLLSLVQRARMLQGAFGELHHELMSDLDTGDRCAFAFRLSGRHVGPLVTPLGEIAPTGRQLTVTGMDIFVLRDDRVAEIWALADMLGLLLAAGALTPSAGVVTPSAAAPAPALADRAGPGHRIALVSQPPGLVGSRARPRKMAATMSTR